MNESWLTIIWQSVTRNFIVFCIFFFIRGKISELLRVRQFDVDLRSQRYKVLIQKGRQCTEVWKTIKDIALPYWASIMNECKRGQFVFSVGLNPGDKKIQPYQIGKRWYRLVKKRLGVTADFYSLKHLQTTEIAELLTDVDAAKHNSHLSTANKIEALESLTFSQIKRMLSFTVCS